MLSTSLVGTLCLNINVHRCHNCSTLLAGPLGPQKLGFLFLSSLVKCEPGPDKGHGPRTRSKEHFPPLWSLCYVSAGTRVRWRDNSTTAAATTVDGHHQYLIRDPQSRHQPTHCSKDVSWAQLCRGYDLSIIVATFLLPMLHLSDCAAVLLLCDLWMLNAVA